MNYIDCENCMYNLIIYNSHRDLLKLVEDMKIETPSNNFFIIKALIIEKYPEHINKKYVDVEDINIYLR